MRGVIAKRIRHQTRLDTRLVPRAFRTLYRKAKAIYRRNKASFTGET